MQRISITNPQNVIDGTAKKYYFKLRNTGGPKGDKGDKGDTGQTGPQGPKGDAATVAVGSTTTLPVGYDATVENVGSIYNAVLNFGIPQGPQGPQGAKGDKGDTGAQGETGPRGPQGERGTNATVYVGTTSTLAPGSQATVYNSGTDSNAVLNFGIPQGAKGDTGSQGPQGPTGPAGQNFAPTIVAELPATGDESKLYLTPKAHTTSTATGNPVTATVAEQAGKIESFQLDGDTFQQSYTGKNVLELAEAINKRGLTITLNKISGSITFSGTTNGTWPWLSSSSANLPAGTYTFSIDKALPYQIAVRFYETGSSYPTSAVIDAGQTSATATTAYTTVQTTVLLGVTSSGTTVKETTIYPQIEAGSTVSDFEPFVGERAAPNPDYPQPIQTVTGEQTASIVGKNLFNKNAVTNGGYIDTNGEVVPWETFGYSEYIRVIGGQTYSYSGTANNIGYSAKAAWYDSNKNFISAFSFGTSGQVTAPATAKFLRTSVRIASPSGLDTYQLELGSTITTYEAYKATNYPISLGSIELCKLGTYQDYIYKDGDDWKVHKATKAIYLKDITWLAAPTSVSGKYRMRTGTAPDDILDPADNNTKAAIKSSVYDVITAGDTYAARATGISVQASTPHIFIYDPNYNTLTSPTSFTQKMASTNATAYYALATATDTTITDTALIAQLEAISNAQLATGANTIANNATAPNLAGDMEIGYYGYNPTNRYDKWIWLDFDNSYEQLNNPETTATLSSTRSLSTTTEQTTPTRSVETITLKKGRADSTEDKTGLPTILDDKTEEAVKEEYTEPVVEDSEIVEEPEEENSEQVESEKEEIKEKKTDSEEPVEERKEER